MSAKTFLTAAVLLWDGSGSFGRPVTGTSQAYVPDSVHDMDEPIGPSASPEVGEHLAKEAPEVRGQVADGGGLSLGFLLPEPVYSATAV